MQAKQTKTGFRFGASRNLMLAAGMVCCLCWRPIPCAAAEKLVIDYIVSHSAQRTAWIRVISEFSAANPDVQVTHNGFPQEQYKRDFTARLKSGKVDVAFWYAGERLRDAAANKLLAPLDPDTVALLKKRKFYPVTIDGTRIDGEVYGFPMYYYPWGFVYRKSLFKQLGIAPPATWDEFLHACERLSAAGVTPIGLGAAANWPAAGWFDYFDLRLNGLDFHRKLLRGDVPFTDARVRRIFDMWAGLLRKGYFLPATIEQEHERVLPYMYRNHVGMMLMGSFIAAKFPQAIAGDMGFFAFPAISPEMPAYEDAPLDVLVLPAKSPNPQFRKRFLAFLAESGAIRHIAEADQTLPAQADTTFPPILLGDPARQVLNRAAGLSSFFDREADSGLIGPVFEGLRLFLKPPHDAEQAVLTIETLRQK
ncbi:ABC transporter substrate-binding protein [Duganella sp. Root1480D1]|uniref:ABC transporter substrate-binding protein n=1 Tax=Duganella sp. Root1480D1 TaxID=1736471 RepID=UPI00070E486B|nr:extracellular solute-binding protein [Duganella sp. Root1480D1]